MAPRLASPLPPWHQTVAPALAALVRALAHMAEARGWRARLVGGFVRDWLLGRPSLDLDLVFEGRHGVWTAPPLAREAQRRFGGRVQVHRAFGTAVWHLPSAEAVARRLHAPRASANPWPEHLDLVTARRERYPQPAALPQVQPGSLLSDLYRRDFTINAMAIDLAHDDRLLDPFDGRTDLAQGRLRVLHRASFRDDPTRLFRGARYLVRYQLQWEPETQSLIPSGLKYIPRLSGDRVRHELDRILDEPTPGPVIGRLGTDGVARAVHPALPADADAQGRVERLQALDAAQTAAWGLPPGARRAVGYALWWLPLPEPALASLCQRLACPKALRTTVQAAAELWRARARWAALRPGAMALHLDRYPRPAVVAVALAAPPPLHAALDRYLRHDRDRKPLLTGHDLRALGLKPGPRFGELLRALRMAQIEGRVRTRDEALAWLQEQLADDAGETRSKEQGAGSGKFEGGG